MSILESADVVFGHALAERLADDAPEHLRLSPFAVSQMATYILEQQPGLSDAKTRTSDRNMLYADQIQQRFNANYGITASFEQSGRLLEKAARLANIWYEEYDYVRAVVEPLQMPGEFKDFHPEHLARLATYFAPMHR